MVKWTDGVTADSLLRCGIMVKVFPLYHKLYCVCQPLAGNF